MTTHYMIYILQNHYVYVINLCTYRRNG